jgi:cell division septation protein DedD
MLAAGLANRAIIQEYLRQPGADRTASEALQYSTDVWQANLMCANVLQRHQKYQAAEDAILRNLDVNLERESSLAALVHLYRESRDPGQLRKRLNEPGLVSSIPVASLIECLTVLDGHVPPAVRHRLQSSCYATTDARFGPDDIVCHFSSQWKADRATVTLYFDGREIPATRVQSENSGHEVRFVNVADFGSLLRRVRNLGSIELQLSYPGQPAIRLSFERLHLPADSLVSYNANTVPRVYRRGAIGIARIRVGQDEVDLLAHRRPPVADAPAKPTPAKPTPAKPTPAKPTPADSANPKPTAGPRQPDGSNSAVQLLPLEPIE